jgi:anaerobic magnesium-protoporphyrin IX monomethyl ester cyclase
MVLVMTNFKIAFISTPTRTNVPNGIPPLGILYLAAYLRKNGYAVQILDVARTRQSNETIIQELKDIKPDLIAISGIITAYKFIYDLVKDLKQSLPDIPIVIGGHVVLDTIDLLLKKIGCDYVITSYGEKSLMYLCEALENKRELSDIPGLSYIENDIIHTNHGLVFFENIDDIPQPAYDLVDMEYYVTIEKHNPTLQYCIATDKLVPFTRSASIIGARGCTDRCSFCVHEFEHRGFYVHSIKYVMENIEILYNTYNVRIFIIGEDLFLYKPEQASQLVVEMNTRFPDAYFTCNIRADYVNRELVNILSGSNCFAVFYGFESGDEKILKMLGKRMKPSINISAYKTIKTSSIKPTCSFMIGSPGETDIAIQNTIDAIKEAGVTEGGIFYTTPYPGSRLFRWCVEQKRIVDIHEYLLSISNKDASQLRFNFTPYPDIIVKCMYVMVQNAFYDNMKKTGKKTEIGLRNRVVKHWFVPMVYHGYFGMRWLFDKVGCSGDVCYELNKKGTVRLSSDKE